MSYFKHGSYGKEVLELQRDLIDLGYKIKADADFGPMTEKALKDFQSRYGLEVDGIFGPITQKRIDNLIASHADQYVDVDQKSAPWMDFMMARYGWNESKNDAELAKFWKYTNVPGFKTVRGSDHAWCAMIVCAALEETGFESTKNAAAISYDSYGNPIKAPKFGAIITVSRSGGSGRHVTFFSHFDTQGNLVCLGGNQSDSICYAVYSPSRVKSINWPIAKRVELSPIA